MGGKVKDKLEDGVKARKVRLEHALVRSEHAIVVKNLDLILKGGCALTSLERKEQREGKRFCIERIKQRTELEECI